MEIGKYIKEFRDKNKISQEKFGKIIGVSKQTVSKLESGKLQPTTKMLYEIVQAIDISLDEASNEKEPFIYERRTKYDVGLNSIFNNVHDYDSFYYFIDSFTAAYKLITPLSKLVGGILKDKNIPDASYEDVVPIIKITCSEKTIILKTHNDAITFTQDNVISVKKHASFNNEEYLFHLCTYDGDRYELFMGIQYEE